MKKILALFAVLAVTTTLSASAAETKVGSFLDKLNQKEQELNQRIDATQKARAEQRATAEKKQAEQKAALEKRQAELKKQQAANQKALEQAKKDAQARQDARKKAIEAEKTYWKGVLNK